MTLSAIGWAIAAGQDSGSFTNEEADALYEECCALLRRDWAVRVLVELLRHDHITYTGFPVTMLSQTETMRIAKERFYYLSHEVREELGECP